MNAIVFEGQGSQRVGMGKDLFNLYPELVEEASNILDYDLVNLCLKNPERKLHHTEFTQPAIFVVNHLQFLKESEKNDMNHFVLGHSLGEYNALVASNILDFTSALRLVKSRGELMGRSKNGGMAAVIGVEPDKIQSAINEAYLDKEVFIANYNSKFQTVISGRKESVLDLQDYIQNLGAKLYLPLNVSGAFHTPYMEEARNEFQFDIESTTINLPKTQIISNV